MASAFSFAFANLGFQIDVPDESWVEIMKTHYQGFIQTHPDPWHIQLLQDPRLDYTPHPWASHEKTITRFRIAFYRGEVDLLSKRAWVSTPTLEKAPSALARVVTFIATWALPRQEALLLHATGLGIGGKGFAFAGASGAGKTTIAGLAPLGSQIIGDENVIIRLEGDTPTLYSTPFWGQNTPESQIQRMRVQYPLTVLFILKQSPHWFLRPLRASEAILSLLATEKVAVERTESARAWLDVASRLIAQIPVFELGFLPSPELWPFLATQGFRDFLSGGN